MSTQPDRLRRDLLDIVSSALSGVAAPRLVSAALNPPPADLTVGRLWLVAAGKAGGPMARTFAAWAGPRLTGGVVVVPASSRETGDPGGGRLEWVGSAHPDPDERSELGARRALEKAQRSRRAGDTLVVLLSGGASSLMALPAEGLHIEDKSQLAHALMTAGAAIDELNTVRKHLSAIKGGRLAAEAGATVTLAISDVVAPVADDPAVIGSGPTVADPTTFVDALRILERRGLRTTAPRAALAALEAGVRGEREETIKPGDLRLARSHYQVIGSRTDALSAARHAAESLGFAVLELVEATVGEAAEAGARLMKRAVARAAGMGFPVCVLAAGETVVTVRGTGRGGRNQELALGALIDVRPGRPFVLASVGTDGVDGPTDAAGALADQTTLARAAAAGLGDPRRYLANNDSYRFFDALGDLIRTGPTDTNVGDLQVILFS